MQSRERGTQPRDGDPSPPPARQPGGSGRSDEDFARNEAARRGGSTIATPRPSESGRMKPESSG